MKTLRHIAYRIFFPGMAGLFLILMAGSICLSDEDKRVLIINSYHSGFSFSDAEVAGVRSVLPPGTEVHIEYMDAKLMSGDRKTEGMIYELLRHKYGTSKFDAIVSVDDDAFQFLLRHHPNLFPDVPVIFIGVNKFEESMLNGKRNFTGVVETTDIEESIALALRLHPGAQKVYVVTDNTTTGKINRKILEAIDAKRSLGVPLHFLDQGGGISFRELLDRLRSLPPGNVVYYADFFQDRTGRTLSPEEAMKAVSGASGLPVYVHGDMYLGSGATGGKVISGFYHGQQGGAIVRRILEGTAAGAVPVERRSITKYMFDNRQLERFGVLLTRLPPDSIVLFKEPAIFDQYRVHILSIIGFILFLLAAITVLLVNVTRRKRVERALKEEEKKYRELVENANSIILRMDKDGNVTFFNEFAQRFFDYNEKDIVGRNVVGTIVPEHETTGRDLEYLIKDIGKHPELYTNNVNENMRRNGERVWIAWTNRLIYNKQKDAVEILCIGNDITERKQAEEALRNERDLSTSLIESSPVFFVAIDRDGSTRMMNKSMLNALGYTIEEVIGKDYLETFVPDTDREPTRAVFSRLIGESQKTINENKILTKDGSELLVEWHGRAVMKSDGGFDYFFGVGVDITERKHLEGQLRQAQKMEAIGTLAGGVAHDFNNILTVMTGYATIMQAKMDTFHPLRVYVDQILAASHKATDLTRSLLAFSRKQPVSLVPLDINSAISETKKLLIRLLTEDIELRTAFTDEETIVMADKSQIDQILFNLVANARDAMPKGGKLTIETSRTVLDNRFMTLHGFGESGRYVRVSISDTGMGMDEMTREKIFDPFFTTKETGKGTGLGLATVYGIVKQHRGYIIVESMPDKGTTFHLYFPAVEIAIGEEGKGISTPTVQGHETILIAEDNDDVRNFIREVLEQHGYKTLEARDGEEAIKTFKQRRNIDLVIIDSVMPKKNGREVYEEIHRLDPRVRVLFTSGYTKDVILDKGIEEKEIDFIAKPLSVDTFLQKIWEVLNK